MGARGSKCFAKTKLEEEASVIAWHNSLNESYTGAEVSETKAVEVAEESSVPSVDERTEPWYLEALERCAELRRTHEKLLLARKEVRACIARFAPAFDSDEQDDLSIPQCLPDEATMEYGQFDSDEDEVADEMTVEQHATPRSYQDLLAEEEELEEEVEMLQETLQEAMAMIGNVVRKSQQLSEHLDEFENQMNMPKGTSSTSDTNSDDGDLIVQVSNAEILKPMMHQLKLPSLKLLAVPGIPGSEASSSTATPRSESQSRITSPRSESCYCEVY
jgi:hypothetical protein